MTLSPRLLCLIFGHSATFYHPQQEGSACTRCMRMVFRDGSVSRRPWNEEYAVSRDGEQQPQVKP